MKGLFITFEGMDGAGKSTHVSFLAESLRALGYAVVVTREPGGCPLAEKIREVLLDNQNVNMSARAEALLYAAARAEHVEKVIIPAIASGAVVICDRFVDSSLAYQGGARGLGMEAITQLNNWAMQDLWPDITFFMRVTADSAADRRSDREPDRLEQEPQTFHAAVAEGFGRVLAQHADRIQIIDATPPKPEVAADILTRCLAAMDNG